jgi:histone-lysine N-methyltransferase ASH1L
MFESIVNFLSPAPLSSSTSLQAAAAGSKMARRTRSSLGSAPTTIAAMADSDHQPSDAADEAIGVDFSGPLLTPENSRSETSSTNELGSGEEKPVLRRRSARATRTSLRGLERLREAEEDNQTKASESSVEAKGRTVSGETLVDSIAESNGSHSSSLRHSIAVMENSWSQATLQHDGAQTDEYPRCDTPVSKESHESTDPPLRRRSLREPPEKIQTKTGVQTKGEQEQKVTVEKDKQDNAKSLRRSSRLSLVSKASDFVDRASSVLGKRSRDMMEKSKEILSRRASLRPRHSLPVKEEPSASAGPASKKRRVSEGDLPSKTATKESPAKDEEPQKSAPAAPRYKPKRWLTEGLYTGQDRFMDPRLNEAKNKIKSAKRTTPVERQRKYLPMPMFAGERLLKNGRDFKLPFDIFSPLPPGQPKPDEWRKVNKSKYHQILVFWN